LQPNEAEQEADKKEVVEAEKEESEIRVDRKEPAKKKKNKKR
jgi:hypothetical protein